VISAETLQTLRESQQLLMALAENLDEEALRTQFHPDLSALGWHLGHCVYIECYWLHEVVRGDDRVTAPIMRLYTPPLTPKPERGALLPPRDELLSWAQHLQGINLDFLANLEGGVAKHELFEDDYLPLFLQQHNSQHYETMLMVLSERALAQDHSAYRVREPLTVIAPRRDTLPVQAGHYRIGGQRPLAFDNELPPQQVDLGPFEISRHPVSNGEYLAFMEDNGYGRRELWSAEGWQWCEEKDIRHPHPWRLNDDGHWYGVGVWGPYDLSDEGLVIGLSCHEALAYSRWADARLPHEHQWEVACRLRLPENTGRVWEWCRNTFFPYAGFKAFPYEEYSTPWYDGRHYTLRGGSLYTRPAIKRCSFRNFYEADKRHIFSGVRLVY
jgi:iron(II)-dependent oxidoreductase